MNESAISHILSLTADPYPEPDYQVCRTPEDLDNYLDFAEALCNPKDPSHLLISEDTENTPDGLPYCFTFSNRPGTGRLIYVHDRVMVNAYRESMTGTPWGTPYHHVFHNWLHDDTKYSHPLLNLPSEPFTDTMVRAYNLCLGGGVDDETESRAGRGALGLKVLARRYCNIRMTSFKETVYPHSIPKMLDWLRVVSDTFEYGEPPSSCEHCQHLSDDHVLSPKGSRGKCSLCACKRHKKHTPRKTEEEKKYGLLCRKSNNLIKALTENTVADEWEPVEEDDDEEDDYNLVDPWKRVRGWHPHDRKFLSDVGLERYPLASIADVPEPALLRYACRDADATLRLFLFLQNHYPWIFY